MTLVLMDLVRGVGINLFLVPNGGHEGDRGMMPNKINQFPYGMASSCAETTVSDDSLAAAFATSSHIATVVAIRHPLRGDVSIDSRCEAALLIAHRIRASIRPTPVARPGPPKRDGTALG